MNILFLLRPKVNVAYLYHDNTLRQGLEKMRAHGYTALPVIERDGRYVGTVSEGDFLWAIVNFRKADVKTQETSFVRDILRPAWNPAVTVNATMDELLLRVMEQNFVPVVDDRQAFVGIITRKDVIHYFYEKEQAASLRDSAAG